MTGQTTLGVTFASFGNTLRRGLRVWLESRHGQRSKRVESSCFPPVRAKRPLAKHRPEIGAKRHSASHREAKSCFALWIHRSQTARSTNRRISRDRIRVCRFPEPGKRCFGLNSPSPSWGGHKASGRPPASRGFIYQSPSVSAKSLRQDVISSARRVPTSRQVLPGTYEIVATAAATGSLKSIARSGEVTGLQRPSPQVAKMSRPGPVGGRSGACRGGI